MHAFWLVLTYDLLEDRHIDCVIIKKNFPLFFKNSGKFWKLENIREFREYELLDYVKSLFSCLSKWGKDPLSSYFERFWNKQAFLYILFLYYIKQIDSILPCVCSVIHHRRRQNVVRLKKVAHSAIESCATFLFLPHFDDLNRQTATWNLYVNITQDFTYVVPENLSSSHLAVCWNSVSVTSSRKGCVDNSWISIRRLFFLNGLDITST